MTTTMRMPWRLCSRKMEVGTEKESETLRVETRSESSLPASRKGSPGHGTSVTNPLIDVDGDRAHGVWYLIAGVSDGTKSEWGTGRYHEDYVKQNGEWKFRRVRAK